MRTATLLFALVLAAPVSGQTTYTWVGGSGDWFSAGSWSPAGVPGDGDTAVVTSGSPTVTRDTTVAVLDFGGASLDGDGHLTVTGSMEWSAGQMNGRGFAETAALTIAPGATLRITGDDAKGVRGRDLFNEGTVVWEGTGNLVVMWTTTFENRAGATFDIQADARLTRTNGTLQLVNDGLLVKSSGAGQTVIEYPFGSFVNEGTVRAEVGTLFLGNGTSAFTSGGDGAFEVADGATLLFNTFYTFGPGSTLSGAGRARFTNGSTQIGRATMTGLTQITGGTLRLMNTDTPSELADVSVSGGALGGPAETNVNGLLTWTGGALGTEFGSVGTVTVLGNAEVSGTAVKPFDGGTVVNASTFRWLEGPLGVSSSSSFLNLAGATVSIECDESWTRSNGFINVINQGLIVKTGTAGQTTIALPFAPIHNDGEVRVESGTLSIQLSGSGTTSTDTGRYTVDEGAALAFGGHTRTFTADAVVEGAGTVALGGDIRFDGTLRPLAPTRVLAVAGDWPAMQTGGVLELAVGGTTPGTEHDQLAVTGTAALGGTLRVTFTDGFTLADDDRILLVSAAATTGTFDAIELPAGIEGYIDVTAAGVELVAGSPVAHEDGAGLPTAVALHAPYPNPSAGTARVAYDLPHAGPVRLAVYDVLGRTVAVLAAGERAAGRYQATLDGAALAGATLAPGLYLVRLDAGDTSHTRSLTVAR